MRKAFLASVLGIVVQLQSVLAEDAVALKYSFKPGQVIRYEGTQKLNVESTVSGTTQKFSSETTSLREWRAVRVDEKGNARLTLTIVRVQVSATSPGGKKVAFDSADPTAENPLGDIVGKPLVELTVSPLGEVTDIRESESASAGQFVAHVRAMITPLPNIAVAAGTGWQRDLTLPLQPPVGSGEKITVRQIFRLEKVANSVATINLQSSLAEETKDRALAARVAQFLPSGRIEMDFARGVLRSMTLTVDRTVDEFAGPGSSVRVSGTSQEVLVEEVAGAQPGR